MTTRQLQITGWTVSLLGTAIYLYGYLTPTAATLISWPSWAASYVPNPAAEAGLLLACLAMIPLYWPVRPAAE